MGLRGQIIIFFFLFCGYVYPQDKNPLAFFEEIPKISNKIAHTSTVDSVVLLYNEFEKQYPLISYYQLNAMLDQVRLTAIDRLIGHRHAMTVKIAIQLDNNKMRWQQLERIQPIHLPQHTIDSLGRVLLSYDSTISRKKELWQNQYADLLYFTRGAEAAEKYCKKIGWGTKEEANTPLLSAHLYDAKGNASEAVKLLSAWVKKGNADQYIKDKLAFFYDKLPDKTLSFIAYEASLMQDLRQVKLHDKEKYAVNYPAPAFSLNNLTGDQRSLLSLKGKVVILDFWATWCKPCIAAFPAMQTVVERYKDNPNVVFLFVNTLERKQEESNRESHLIHFIREKNVDFEVLLDKRLKDGYEMATAYHVSSIPTQFILDADGVVRYRLSGFSGEVDSFVEELTAIVDSLLEEVN